MDVHTLEAIDSPEELAALLVGVNGNVRFSAGYMDITKEIVDIISIEGETHIISVKMVQFIDKLVPYQDYYSARQLYALLTRKDKIATLLQD